MGEILKIDFSGASSTGKSTLCQYCADLYNEPCAVERMRDVMIKRGIGITQITNDVFIEASELQQQDIKLKEKQATKYLFIDSGPLIFYLGNKYSFGRDFPLLKDMALDFYKTQDIVFLCDNHIAFDDSLMRGDAGTKDILHKSIVNFLDENQINYKLVSGSVRERGEQVKDYIRLYEQELAKKYEEKYNFLPAGLRLIAKAYCETDVPNECKEEALIRLSTSYNYLHSSTGILPENPECVKIVRQVLKLQELGALGNNYEINDPSVFKMSDLVRFSAGLGKFRDLTETQAMTHCREIQSSTNKSKQK